MREKKIINMELKRKKKPNMREKKILMELNRKKSFKRKKQN
uniref:Uncharacterized protein n=1 Tax=Manihot esculenta TaxID=3983 RepID=A0A2C9V9M3_MANES